MSIHRHVMINTERERGVNTRDGSRGACAARPRYRSVSRCCQTNIQRRLSKRLSSLRILSPLSMASAEALGSLYGLCCRGERGPLSPLVSSLHRRLSLSLSLSLSMGCSLWSPQTPVPIFSPMPKALVSFYESVCVCVCVCVYACVGGCVCVGL